MHQKQPPAKYALFFSDANTEFVIIKFKNINNKNLMTKNLYKNWEFSLDY